MEKEVHNKLFRVEVGTNAYKNGKNDYEGRVGYVYFCDKCCKDWRVQFFNIANNELLRNFNFAACKVFFAQNRAKTIPPIKE